MAESATPCVASWQHIAFFPGELDWSNLQNGWYMLGQVETSPTQTLFFGGMILWNNRINFCQGQCSRQIWQVFIAAIGEIFTMIKLGQCFRPKCIEMTKWPAGRRFDLRYLTWPWLVKTSSKGQLYIIDWAKHISLGAMLSMIQWWCIEKFCFYASCRRRNINHTQYNTHKPWK